MMTRSLRSRDGTLLRADYHIGEGIDRPAGSRGIVVIVHGYCEHRSRYRHVAEHLVRQGYAVLCGDLRGHGESDGRRGFINRFGEYVEDVAAFVAEARSLMASSSRDPGNQAGRGASEGGFKPTTGSDGEPRPILLGHSLGGLVTLQFVLAHPNAVRAIALSSPFLGLKLAVPAWKRGLALFASLVYPTLRMANGIDANDVSHHPDIRRGYASDPLISHGATARFFTETLSAQADVRSRANRVRVPALFLQAGDDRLVDLAASQRVFSCLGSHDKTQNVYPGLFHEVFNELEPDRGRVLSDLASWLNER